MKYDCHVEISDFVDASGIYGRGRAILCAEKLSDYLISRQLRPVLILSKQFCNIDSYISSILAELEPSCRVVASVAAFTDKAEIVELHRVGVRGVCVKFERSEMPVFLDRIRAIDQVIPSAWHMEIIAPWSQVIHFGASLARIRRSFVVHCYLINFVNPGVVDLDRLRWWSGMGNLYVKFLGEFPKLLDESFNNICQILELINISRDRVVWGSCWPVALNASELLSDNRFAAISGYERDFELNARELYDF